MAGTHNFKVFDANNSNMTTDTDYNADAARLSGVVAGKADPLSANKAWHQSTIMAAAIAQYMANQGVNSDDTNLLNLVSALAASFATPGGTSYADRIAHALQAAADVGQIGFCPAQPTPAAATYTASGTGNLNGAYIYREVLISGYKNPDGSYFVRGFSPAASRGSADASPASQQVVITNLPLGTAGCIGRAIYRSAAGGAAASEQFCGIVWDNTARTFTDNLVDSQLGAGMPEVQGMAIPAAVPVGNMTGTTLPAAQVGALRTYTTLSELGFLSSDLGSETIISIVEKMSDNSQAMVEIGSSNNTPEYPSPFQVGTLFIIRRDNLRVSCMYTQSVITNPKVYVGQYRSDGSPKFGGWKLISDGGTASDTTSINSALTISTAAPSSTLAVGKLWGVY